jgi:hypothetical protein
METAEDRELTLEVTDVSKTKRKAFSIKDAPSDSTVGELIEGVLPGMSLPGTDVAGRPLVYHARLEREGRHLHSSERLAEAVQSGDELVLQPNVDAGSAAGSC